VLHLNFVSASFIGSGILSHLPTGTHLSPPYSTVYSCDFILEEEVDEEAFLALDENLVKDLVPKVGSRSKFLGKLRNLKV
jgi:hypothetical protein